jgi:hypothetical protein
MKGTGSPAFPRPPKPDLREEFEAQAISADKRTRETIKYTGFLCFI